MDRDAMKLSVLGNAGPVIENHLARLEDIYDVSESLGDVLTQFYGNGIEDITVPGSTKGTEVLNSLAPLMDAFREGNQYVAVVRARTRPQMRYGGLKSKVVGQNVKQAFVRIYKDLNPDAVQLKTGQVEIQMQGCEGPSAGLMPFKAIEIAHPSHIFTQERATMEWSQDDQPTVFASTFRDQEQNHLWTDEQPEYDIPPTILSANTAGDLNELLLSHGLGNDFEFGVLEGVVLGNPTYAEWLRNEMVSQHPEASAS